MFCRRRNSYIMQEVQIPTRVSTGGPPALAAPSSLTRGAAFCILHAAGFSVDPVCSAAGPFLRYCRTQGPMLHPHSHQMAARPLFFGAAQSLSCQLPPQLHAQAQPLTSVAAFQPDRSSAQIAQQVSRAIPSSVVSLEPVSTAVSNNVQVLGSGVRSVTRPPKAHTQRKKHKLRVAVDVDEGEGF